MFRTSRSPTALTATRCASGHEISWSGLEAPGVQSQSSTPRLTCGATTRRQARHWRLRRAAQPLSSVWRSKSYAKSLVRAERPPKDDIAALIQEDVDARVQKVLDAMRIIESNAVRPGKIGGDDNGATAEALSGLVNLICEKMIMEPRHLQAVYKRLREGALNAMERQAQGSS